MSGYRTNGASAGARALPKNMQDVAARALADMNDIAHSMRGVAVTMGEALAGPALGAEAAVSAGSNANGDSTQLDNKDLDTTLGPIMQSFERIAGKIELDFTDLGGSLKKTFKNAERSILNSLQQSLSKNLNSMFSELLGGIGDGGTFGSLFSSLFGFGKAGGGRISAHAPVLVGERGPELLLPDRTATVMNGADSRIAGASGNTQINQNVKFDLVPEPTVEAMIRKQLPAIRESAIEGAIAAIRNRGY